MEGSKKTQFKPGKSGNPGGRPKGAISQVPTALKNLTVQTYRDVIDAICTGNVDNLKAMAANPNISALQVGVARAFLKAIQRGDYQVIERIAERVIGKLPDELNINSMNVNLDVKFDKVKLRLALEQLNHDV